MTSCLFFKVIAIPMLAPRSYTREDVVELQCHGSEVCLRRVLRACLEAGARLADPGQLSAFLFVFCFLVMFLLFKSRLANWYTRKVDWQSRWTRVNVA